jgi:hypothetical protein
MNVAKQSLADEALAMQKIGSEFEKLPKESQLRVVQWLSSVLGKDEIPSQQESQGQSKIQSGDIRKFFESKAPKNNYEKIAVVAYYYELIQKKGNFTLDDITKLWDETKEVLPGKQVINNAWRDCRSKYQYITACQGTKQNRIATRGQKLVEALPAASKDLRGGVKSRKKKKDKK